MSLNLGSFLDGTWLFLCFVTLLVTISLATGLLLHFFARSGNPLHLQKAWRWSHAQIFAFCLMACAALALGLEQTQLKCFQDYALQTPNIAITRALAGLWLTVGAAILAVDFLRLRKLFAQTKSWSRADDENLLQRLQATAKKLGVENSAHLFLLENAGSPFVFGFSPKIVLPASLAKSLDSSELESVFAHELAHVKSRDFAWNLLALFNRRLFFFHPLMWLSENSRVEAQERSADWNAVRATGMSVGAYLQSFVRILELQNAPANEAPYALGANGFKVMKKRFESLGRTAAAPESRATGFFFLIILLLSCTWIGFEAKASLLPERKIDSPLMCVQLNHERTLEKILLQKEPEPLRCEK